jgi:hypothetical protein
MFRFLLLVLAALILTGPAEANLDQRYARASGNGVPVRCFYDWNTYLSTAPYVNYSRNGAFVEGTAYLGPYICNRLRYIVEWRQPRSRIMSTDYAYAVFALAHETAHAETLVEDEADCLAAQRFTQTAKRLGIGWRRNVMAALAQPVLGYHPPVPCWPI